MDQLIKFYIQTPLAEQEGSALSATQQPSLVGVNVLLFKNQCSLRIASLQGSLPVAASGDCWAVQGAPLPLQTCSHISYLLSTVLLLL